jgi:glycosyltransferase involved in cell wall biosynthesis
MNNFLSIVWYRVLPPEYGGQKGIADFNECLGEKVSLTCLCSRNNKTDRNLPYKLLTNLPVSRFQFWNRNVRKQILSFVSKQTFTHIIIEHPYHAWLGKYKQQLRFRFIVHAHNIEHLRMKTRGKLWWQLVKRIEQKAFTAADHILFKTEADKVAAINIFKLAPEKCLVVPYGTMEMKQPAPNPEIKKRIKKKYDIAADEKIILFAGTLDYEPNAEALDIILNNIIPLLHKHQFRFRLIICGSLSSSKIAAINSLPHVTAAGFVLSLQDHLQAADVFINPVISGSGIQTKNIEAIANGCNVVSTGFAAAGLPAYLINEKLFISPDHDPQGFVNNIIKASLQVRNTPQQFYEDHNWQQIISRLLPVIAPEE